MKRKDSIMSRTFSFVAGLLALTVVGISSAAPQPTTPSPAAKVSLRYKFHPGETIRWQVTHQAQVETMVSGTTQTAETNSQSIKVWRVVKVAADGSATFENLVESVDMRQKLSGRMEVRYNSQTDKTPPAGFEHVARMLGIPITEVTIDRRGQVLDRRSLPTGPAAAGQNPITDKDAPITIVLPEQPVGIGQSWPVTRNVDAPLDTGTVKKIKTLETFTLKSVKNGVATIGVTTQILTPIDDPGIEAQLIQRESSGSVRFDIAAGRMIGQQVDIDKKVLRFRGEASSLQYKTRFTEELLPNEAKAATAVHRLPRPDSSPATNSLPPVEAATVPVAPRHTR
jgi:hypothetical protein